MQTLINLLEFLRPYGSHSYAVMFGILLACGFGFPMPEDVVLITGGILASRGVTAFPIVVFVTMAGVLIGDSTVFAIGRYFGPSLKSHRFIRRIFPEHRNEQVLAIMHKYGDKVIFMARFMPGLRTPIFLTCGIFHVKPWKFLVFDGAAAVISVPLWCYVGYLFGENLEELERRIRQFQYGVYGVLLALIVAFIVFSVLKRRTLHKLEGR